MSKDLSVDEDYGVDIACSCPVCIIWLESIGHINEACITAANIVLVEASTLASCTSLSMCFSVWDESSWITCIKVIFSVTVKFVLVGSLFKYNFFICQGVSVGYRFSLENYFPFVCWTRLPTRNLHTAFLLLLSLDYLILINFLALGWI